MILQLRDAVTAAMCEQLIDVFERHRGLATARDYSGFPVLPCFKAPLQTTARALVAAVVDDCRGKIEAGLEIPPGTLALDTALLTALGVGGHHPRHADNASPDGPAWVPNHTPHRAISALLYLNGGFDGGELVFDRQRVEIRPEAALFVAFPSGFEYPHEVRPVTRGLRYSMPIWFKLAPGRSLPLFATDSPT